MKDTIVALATPQVEKGAIGIIRMSGERALEIVRNLFTAQGFDNVEPNKMYLGRIATKNFNDRAFCMYCKAPKSYTGEDIVELHTHGGKIIIQGVIRELVALGARPAAPGEFTKRAYLNGKLNLAEAEGLADMINAQSEAEVNQAYRLMRGEVSKGIEELKTMLLTASANIEVALDYPEELLEDTASPTLDILNSAKQKLKELYETSKSATIAREGVSIALAGLTNVGKSSLMNAILKDERAIVTDIAGTTRDVLAGSFMLDGVNVEVLDTAGIRESDDPVEKIGIERATRAIEGADLVLFVSDTSEAESEEEKALFASFKNKKIIRVANKADIAKFPRECDIVTEAKSGKNVDKLVALISEALNLNKRLQAPALTRERQIFAVGEALTAVDSAIEGLNLSTTLDCVVVDVKTAYSALASLTGEDVAESVVDEIFSKFCVGK
ncbi:MAG: tRNA uridine-5-carboxymethylaminomethyl(34) synthesis GTPase MnmE [Clostridia bacterium]|nr:tRNA uridine-5-carboxymethylaminomethyl(34) synthesis GTPase MnmE [Clostridia bacterium]MBO7156052.1 tRNA uridine-5-carboxymethylaminomethyl(34) synthesis GTPase MnmE [Clostridia bacterium]